MRIPRIPKLGAIVLFCGALSRAQPPLIVEYPMPCGSVGPDQIAAGPDGALWFTLTSSNEIGRITSSQLHRVPDAEYFTRPDYRWI